MSNVLKVAKKRRKVEAYFKCELKCVPQPKKGGKGRIGTQLHWLLRLSQKEENSVAERRAKLSGGDAGHAPSYGTKS